MNERWLPVVGHDGYDVSDQGRVRSWWFRGRWKKRRDAPVNLVVVQDNYAVVNVAAKRVYVHCLVLEAFVGPRPPGYQCAHADNDPSNCRLSNLRWATVVENMADKIGHGTLRRGRELPRTVLHAEDIPKIRERIRRGESRCAIGRAFGVAPGTITPIATGRTWAWVK